LTIDYKPLAISDLIYLIYKRNNNFPLSEL
jgi:hypothetical protein